MNNKKMIFAIIGIILIICIALFFKFLTSQTETNGSKGSGKIGLSIWIVGQSQNFSQLMSDFKVKNVNYSKTDISFTTFSNYSEYFTSLLSASLNSKLPDIFVLNNNDGGFFDNQIIGIAPNIVSPDDFRKDHEVVFSNDLIKKINLNGKDTDYLKGIPLGYQTLGLFYNFREIRGKSMETWAYINDAISELKQDIGKSFIGIGNGSTVYYASDIITSFFLLDGAEDFGNISFDNIKSVLSTYFRFGDKTQTNGYDNQFENLVSKNQNNIDAFVNGDVQAIIGYPEMLGIIEKKGYNKTFLRASYFPTHNQGSGKILVNYDYLVISKTTKNLALSNDLMRYLSTKEAQQIYLQNNSFFMPSMLSLVNDRLEETIVKDYNIKYKDFFNKNLELTSFNKRYKYLYDKEIINILDKGVNGIDLFENFRKRLLCLSDKLIGVGSLASFCGD